jgi:hypothetical protein
MIENKSIFIALLAVNYGQAVRKYSNELMNIGADAAARWSQLRLDSDVIWGN